MEAEEAAQYAAARTYANNIKDWWLRIAELSIAYRNCYILDKIDHEIANDYFSNLSRLWLALKYKLQGRTDLKELVDKFSKYEVYSKDPQQLAKEGGAVAFEMEDVMSEALEKLKITSWD